ncbi:MAG: ATP synthase F0 subunit B [Desulfobacterales bacterium]|nr:ATP synthase F0 subunit B [Desulfobacterales bacterium]
MDNFNKRFMVLVLIIAGVMVLCCPGAQAFAAEAEGPSWRPTYDLVMKWLNFLILVFIAVKFGRKPIMNFLCGRKAELADEIRILEDERDKTSKEVQKAQQALQDSSGLVEKIRSRIIMMGEKNRQAIIEEAKEQSQAMLEESKRKVGSQINQAKETFRSEMIDAAMDIAVKKLPSAITEKDNDALSERFLESAAAK